MVLEQIMSTAFLERRPFASLLLGFFYTIIGSFTAYVLMRDNVSLASLFFVTLLLVPSLMSLLSIEEERERKEGLRHFFHNHWDVFEIYFFLSLGIFIAYLLIIWFFGLLGLDINVTLSEQIKILGKGLSKAQIENFSVDPFIQTLNLFGINVGVAIIFFILSFFYGAGSICLLVWNTSIFSTFIVMSIQNISEGVSHTFSLLGAFSIYILPEIGGFLLAAIAGGVISKAIVSEKLFSHDFKNVLKDGMVLLSLSFVLLIISALLEAYLAVNWIKALVV